MKISDSTKFFAGLVAVSAFIYGSLLVVSTMPHPAVQIQRSNDLLNGFGSRSGNVVAYSKDTNSIFVAGEFTVTTSKNLQKELQDHPRAQYLVLRSFGREAGSGAAIGALVSSAGIKTLVVDYCYGACASVFMSGTSQFLSKRSAPLMLGISATTGDFSEFEREMDRFAKQPGPNAEKLEGIASEFRDVIAKPVDVKVVTSPTDWTHAEWVKSAAKKVSAGMYRLPVGYFYKKGDRYVVSIVAGTNVSPEDARMTMAHEIYGHAAFAHWEAEGFDMRGMLLKFAHRRPDLIQERAKLYGFSISEKTEAAEEALSRIAETQPTLNTLEDLLASHRIWLRQNLFPNLYYSDKEVIQSYIVPMRQSMLLKDKIAHQ